MAPRASPRRRLWSPSATVPTARTGQPQPSRRSAPLTGWGRRRCGDQLKGTANTASPKAAANNAASKFVRTSHMRKYPPRYNFVAPWPHGQPSRYGYEKRLRAG